MTAIDISNVTKSYGVNGGERRVVLEGLSAHVTDSAFITLVGSNGCGKSTLLNLIAGLVHADSGSVTVETDHSGPPRVGFVWQDYRSSLLPWCDVGENIALPLRIRGVPYPERRRTAERVLKQFSATMKCEQRMYEISGGQQQLVCLLRSTVLMPDLLLLDEPTSALDQQTSWRIAFHIEKLWMERRVPTLLVSHDIDQAIILADEVWVMKPGDGKAIHVISNVLPRPRHVSMLTSQEHLRYRAEVIDRLVSSLPIPEMSTGHTTDTYLSEK